MDSSQVLRQQSQNKIHSDILRMKSEHNKMLVHTKSSKVLSAHQLPDQDIENQDPGKSEMCRKAPARLGLSRLPVLAKSLHLQTPSDFRQSHSKWEEKSLPGKATKKKPCTRPIPFNLSQPRSSRVVTENQRTVSQSRAGAHVVQPSNNACNARQKTQNRKEKLSEPHSSGKTTGSTSQLSGPSSTSKTSATLFNPPSSAPDNTNTMHQSSSTSSAHYMLSAEACLDPMIQLSLKDPTKTSHGSQNTQSNLSKGSSDKGENFHPDHAALLSILRSEGVSAPGLGSVTPQCKAYNYLPQRVPVTKSRQKAGPTAGSVKSVQFSPDPAALQSILENVGVNGRGPVGATPQNPVRPSGRGTSVYTAQRVPVRKNRAEPTEGPGAVALKDTPLKKWTPQRVRNTRHQPMSAMKWHMSTQPSPYAGTPGLSSCKTNPQPRQEQEVVQRLFDDHEDESTTMTDADPETRAEQRPVQAPAIKSLSGENVETSSDEDEEREQRIVGRQPFIQMQHRESVICFSTGKKLLRAPCFGMQESGARQKQQGLVSSEQREVLPGREETSSVSEPTCRIVPSAQSLHRDLIIQKPCALSPAVAMLRKRLPPLEELRMDEEVATYTSVCVPAVPGFLPPRPRCANPLASILHFEESSRFVPIGCDLSSEPSPACCSPLQER